MLTSRTVFILGAGAHMPYGMLSGEDLTKKIIQLLPTPRDLRAYSHSVHPFVKTYYSTFGTGVGTRIDKPLVDFQHKLNHSLHSSIDSFLRTYANTISFPEIGKLAVAMILSPLELQRSWGKDDLPKGDWLTYLFEAMYKDCHASINDFISNNKNVSFVTFNYDRTLEHFMTIKLANTYDTSREEAWNRVKAWNNIIHVYGSLGAFGVQDLDQAFDPKDPTAYKRSVSSIRLMYEDRQEEQTIAAAKASIEQAHTVIFLGFAFDVDNIARLDLTKTCNAKTILGATRMKLTDVEWERVQRDMQPAAFTHMGTLNEDSLQFLRNHNVL